MPASFSPPPRLHSLPVEPHVPPQTVRTVLSPIRMRGPALSAVSTLAPLSVFLARPATLTTALCHGSGPLTLSTTSAGSRRTTSRFRDSLPLGPRTGSPSRCGRIAARPSCDCALTFFYVCAVPDPSSPPCPSSCRSPPSPHVPRASPLPLDEGRRLGLPTTSAASLCGIV